MLHAASRSSTRVLGVLALLISCKAPTQVTLDVSTDALCPGESGTIASLKSVGIAAADEIPATTDIFSATTSTCDGAPRVGTLVLVPAGERGGDLLEVLLVASMERNGVETSLSDCDEARVAGELMGTTCVVARRKLGFVDGVPLTLPVTLEAACIGVTCEEDETCFKGGCVDASVVCDESGCSEPGGGGGGSGPTGTGAQGSGSNGSGASGAGGSGAGAAGPGGAGGAGPGGAGGSGAGGAGPGGAGGAGPGGAGGSGPGGAGGAGPGGAGGSGVGGASGICPPVDPPPDGLVCGTPQCATYCGMCGFNCAQPEPCTCDSGIITP